MTWWYENEEEKMKSCKECGNERCLLNATEGYCLDCPECGVNWKDEKMEFDKSRVYTALNADELKQGDKVIVAYSLYGIKEQVKMFTESAIDVIEVIQDEDYFNRFKVKHGESYHLAYLVERAENCTNCGKHEDCGYIQNVSRFDYMNKCKEYEPKTEEENNMWNYEGLPTRQEMGVSDRVVVAIKGYNTVDIGYYDYDLEGWFVEGCRYPVRVYAWQAIKPPREEE